MGFPDLPLDVWHSIIQDLSLDDLAAVYKVLSTSVSNGSLTIKRVAIKVITTLLISPQPYNETTAEMTLSPNNSTRFPNIRTVTNSSDGPADTTGPSELTSITVGFTSQATAPAFLGLDFNTFNIDMDN